MTLPALFLSHGSPGLILEDCPARDFLRSVGESLPKPKAILVVSAHWETDRPQVTTGRAPETVHDFFGFPEELFAFEYAAPGSPELALEVAELVHPTWIGLDVDSWGLDHGTWSILAHAFPAADVPVVQLSVDVSKPLEHHLQLGAALAPLRDRGVLVVASGNVVHNLAAVDLSLGDAGFDWARRYDDAVRSVVGSDPARFGALADHPDHHLAVPTTDHWLPLAYVAALAAADGEPLDVLVEGCLVGSLSMTSYVVGATP